MYIILMINFCFDQANDLYYIGQLIAMGIVQGSSGVPFLAPPVFDYLCGFSIDTIHVTKDDVPTYEVQQFLKKVQNL